MIKHLALVMDGNRRWAKKQNLLSWHGHKQGTQTVHQVIEFCIEHAIKIVSLYTFSLENFRRSPEEVNYSFNLLIQESQAALPDLIKQGIRIKFIGDPTHFPEHIKPTISFIEQETALLSTLQVNLLFCYGARQEIIHATKHIAQEVQAGVLDPAHITAELFEKHLWGAALPDPELIIRTGGVKRLSNFLLYQAAYSEFYFTDTFWPDLTKAELAHALQDFEHRKEKFWLMTPVTVLGEGAWGTAIATVLAHNNYPVTLWCHDPQVAHDISTTGINNTYLPKIKLSPLIRPVTNIQEAIENSPWIFEATPMKYSRSVLTSCASFITSEHKLILLTKGIENNTLLFPSQLATSIIPILTDLIVLSGPSFAYDVSREQFTKIMLTGTHINILQEAQQFLTTDYFKTESTQDLLGVQVGGAVKNIIALALGFLEGANYQDNTKACVLTQGLAEIAQLSCAVGGQKETIYGLAGLGDLILTATSRKSKNFLLGYELAKSQDIPEILAAKALLPEGINTLISVKQLAEKHQLKLPLISALYRIIYDNKPVASILSAV